MEEFIKSQKAKIKIVKELLKIETNPENKKLLERDLEHCNQMMDKAMEATEYERKE